MPRKYLIALFFMAFAPPLAGQGLPLFSDTAFAQQPQTECPPECVTDSMEIITYYPSPYGYYEELRGDKIIVGDTDNSRIDETHLPPSGTITFEPMLDDPDASDGSLYEGSLYYQGAIGGTKGKFRFYDGSDWQDLGGGGDFWKPSTASGGTNDIYYTQSGNVGIGVGASDTIGAKLQINPQDKQIGLVIRRKSAIGIGSYVSQTSYSYSTPGSYSYFVPLGIDYIRITAYGAQNGGMAQAIFSVTPGEMLYVYVGGKGATAQSTRAGGYNGGGRGGSGGGGDYHGGGGGGASDVRRGGTALADRIIVAGGGGAVGGGGGAVGGAGGGYSGTSAGGGAGGTQTVGGAGRGGGASGSLGTGGNGGEGQVDGGGGGGGGYYGGGGGVTCSEHGGCSATSSGGGGSSYVTGMQTSTQTGVNPGEGKVIIETLLSGSDNSGSDNVNVMEWQNESGLPMSVVDIEGNLALGSSSSNGYKLYVKGNAHVTSGTWAASDLRFKENILPLDNYLDKILNIQPISFDWNKNEYPDMNFAPNRQIGLVAQEVEKQIPELVHTDSNGYKAVAYDKLTAVLVEAVKEQHSQMRSQQKKIEILELKLKELDDKK